MVWMITPQTWADYREQIARAICGAQGCGQAPCQKHLASAESYMQDCEREYDAEKKKR